MLGLARDVTARKQAEERLRASDERWQLALRGNNDGIWDCNPQTDEAFFSPRWKEMLGYAEHEISHHLDEWTNRVYPDDLPGARHATEDHFAGKTPYYISEHRLLCKDGTYKWVLDRGQALWDDQGRVVRVVGSHTDITERKEAEAALRTARHELERRVQERTADLVSANEALKVSKEEAEAASRAKSEFLASMSHELRTPLNAIIGYTDLLLENAFDSLTVEQATVLRRVDVNAKELLDLINSLLDVSRLEAGRLPVTITTVDVKQLLSEVQQAVEEAHKDSNLDFSWNVDATVPVLHTDPGKLKVVIKNLLGNAVKFTKEGSVTVDVHASGGGVEISIADTGIGMPRDVLSVIFDPFLQLDGTDARQYQGAGLGLYIVRRLIELLGGKVEVESHLGRGSIFRVWVPRVSG